MARSEKLDISVEWFLDQRKEKSMKEIANDLGVPYHTLLYWKSRHGLTSNESRGDLAGARVLLRLHNFIKAHTGVHIGTIEERFGPSASYALNRLYRMGTVAISIDGRYFDSEDDAEELG